MSEHFLLFFESKYKKKSVLLRQLNGVLWKQLPTRQTYERVYS